MARVAEGLRARVRGASSTGRQRPCAARTPAARRASPRPAQGAVTQEAARGNPPSRRGA